MSDIKLKQTYIFNGEEFSDTDKIEKYIEAKIGRIIDLSDVSLTPKQKLNIYNALVKNKEELIKMLRNIDIKVDDENWY